MSINLNRFDLTSLRLFVAVLDAGSLTAGAERFGISLAAASKRMAEMETHVGTPLLERKKFGVVPTPTGRTVHGYAIEMLSTLERMAIAVGDLKRGVSGHLQLVANTSSFGGFLPALLAEYSKRYPKVALDLEDAHSEDAVKAVIGGSAELAIIGENTPVGSLQTFVCCRDELVLAVPPGHAMWDLPEVALETVLEHDLIALSRSTSLSRQLAAAADLVPGQLKIRVEVRSFDAMMRMVSAGLGLAILPSLGASLYSQALGLRLLPITGMRLERVLLLAMRSRATLSFPARAFVNLIETHNEA